MNINIDVTWYRIPDKYDVYLYIALVVFLAYKFSFLAYDLSSIYID